MSSVVHCLVFKQKKTILGLLLLLFLFFFLHSSSSRFFFLSGTQFFRRSKLTGNREKRVGLWILFVCVCGGGLTFASFCKNLTARGRERELIQTVIHTHTCTRTQSRIHFSSRIVARIFISNQNWGNVKKKKNFISNIFPPRNQLTFIKNTKKSNRTN